MNLLQRFRKCEDGSTALEFAIVSLLMVVVSVGVIEFGRGLDVRSKLSYAADVGARKVLIDSTTTDSAMANIVRSAFTGLKPQLLQVTVTQETVNGVSFRLLSVSYPLSPLVPNITKKLINIAVARRVPTLAS